MLTSHRVMNGYVLCLDLGRSGKGDAEVKVHTEDCSHRSHNPANSERTIWSEVIPDKDLAKRKGDWLAESLRNKTECRFAENCGPKAT
jgi:hypothetical protein